MKTVAGLSFMLLFILLQSTSYTFAVSPLQPDSEFPMVDEYIMVMDSNLQGDVVPNPSYDDFINLTGARAHTIITIAYSRVSII